MQIAENLMLLNNDDRIALVSILIYDPFEFIFEKAIAVSETLLLKKEVEVSIEEQKKYWLQKKIAEENQKEIIS